MAGLPPAAARAGAAAYKPDDNIERQRYMDPVQRGLVQPAAGLNYMEEQYVKYGRNLGNYHPAPIVGTDSMASVYKSDSFTPEEYNKFFNYRNRHGPDRREFIKYKPKGIDYKMYGDRFHQATVLEDKERLVEYSRRHGDTRIDEARQSKRGIMEGNFSNTFPCSW